MKPRKFFLTKSRFTYNKLQVHHLMHKFYTSQLKQTKNGKETGSAEVKASLY